MKILQHTIFINLEHRKDRLEHVKCELKKININSPIRFNAIKTTHGAIGCTLSHMKCLEIAKKNNWEFVFICEDDITFTDPDTFLTNLTKFYNNKNIQWDICIIGGNNVPPYHKTNTYCARVFNCQTTTGYIVRNTFYDTLIKNFKEGVNKLLKDPNNKSMYAIDIYWKKLQMQYFWYMIIPPTVTQYENYSDIENKTLNYEKLLLDMDKKWLNK